ncbi:unnamed protein product [Ilex paraguariensis]|uniref:Uncharacterized protein n=1 Tax=Ilex paraguariensis TaxID=185542 RepID=A0ABC8U335_9AQUA
MAETDPKLGNSEIIPKDTVDSNRPTNPILSLIPNFLQNFKFPPLKQQGKAKVVTDDSGPPPIETGVKDDLNEAKPGFVRLPRKSSPEVKLEAEECEQNTNTNPVVLWQVYAVGGFFVLRWAWARWNERRGRRKPSDEEPSPADD